jgi:hypothetical protein
LEGFTILSVDVGLETNAVIQIAIDPSRVGSVLSANAEACRLFGYSQQVRPVTMMCAAFCGFDLCQYILYLYLYLCG